MPFIILYFFIPNLKWEILIHTLYTENNDERYEGRGNRMDSEQVTYANVQPDMELPSLEIGPWTAIHIVRWCAAQENWERMHTDYKYATEHDGLPDVIANGNWRKYVIARLFKDWAGRGGWLWKLYMRYTGIHLPGDTFKIWARVIKKYRVDGLGIVELEGGMNNQDGKETAPTVAVVVLPLREGESVPYPFYPPTSLNHESPFQKRKTVEVPRHITETSKACIGKQSDAIESWDEVCKSELRRFSQAIPDPDPIYWDEEYARRTRFETLVAPPLFPVDAFKAPANLPDRLTEELQKDPNFWGGPPWDFRLFIDVPLDFSKIRYFNGGQEFEILQLARLGEKIRAQRRLVDIWEKESKNYSRIVIREDATTYKNSKDEVILQERSFIVYR
jgi:acyl dehydratase